MNPPSQDEHSVQPLNLANLTTPDTNKTQPMIVVEDSAHIHQQQEKQSISLNPDRGNLEKKAVVESPIATTTLPKKLNLAGLVDRVRLAQLEEQRQQERQQIDASSPQQQPSAAAELSSSGSPPSERVMTGYAVPALWLRRDDKGRRPIAVTDSEMDLGMGKQIIFRVELQYGDVKWVIRRSVKDFAVLHFTLAAKRFENLPKFPGQMTYAINMALASLGMKNEDKANYLRKTNLARREALQKYLLQLLQQLNWTVSYDLYEFLEISALSLTKDMGWKGKEAKVKIKVTDHTHTIRGFSGFPRWVENWVILRDSYMALTSDIGSDEPTDVFMFDSTFFLTHREHALGLNMHNIELGNKHRKIEIKGDHNREMLEWMNHFERMKQSSPWLKVHRFGSFAPEREEAKVRYYVDGKDYFHAVSDAILAAKNEIYICDWWLSPELYLRRPPEKNEEFRLDRLLGRKAREGVMIYIVIYKETSLTSTSALDSAHTKIWLQDLHPNIQVQRHPDHLGITTARFWVNHEKICVIDCRLAFIGGLDLCFGRYDSRTHQLSDYHPSGEGCIWPGQDYSNPRIKDFVNVKDYNTDLIERKLLPRMPWHDVSLGVAGPPARDIARHFVQRWNFVKKEKAMKKSHMKFLTPKGEYVSTRNETGWTGSQKVQVLRSSTVWSQGVETERSIQDAYLDSIAKAEHFIYIENQLFVTLATKDGNPDIKNTIGIALVDRILKAHHEGKKFRVIVVMPLMPAFEADIISSEAGTLRKMMHFQYVSISRGGNSVLERLVAAGVDPDKYIGFFGLRSFDRIKHGKFDAIVEAVKEAERQQQQQRKNGDAQEQDTRPAEPMLTEASTCDEYADEPGSVEVEQPVIDNEVDDFITEQLYVHSKLMIVDDRIIICGSGKYQTGKSKIPAMITCYESTILTYEQLLNRVPKITANINDRSQVGFRDSEIAMIIEDTEMIPSFMNGVPYKAGKLAHTLRADLFKEHLGLLPHVEHDVVTKASVLPVDLDKPQTDPEEARLELSRKAQEEEQRLLQQQAQERPQLNLIQGQPGPGYEACEIVAAEGISSRNTNGHHQHRFNDGMGHAQAYTPNQAETDDPKAAEDIVKDPLHDDFYELWWKRVANTNTTIFREVFRCVPDDEVESWDDYRRFVPNPKKVMTGHVAMRDATAEEVNGMLKNVTGHLVEFPTKFLAKENLLGGVVEAVVASLEIYT
ncbi:MAG: hypothetical protein J3Q66DRAFT_366907 [Benniella sp.]|nr:MAG: hypothetical protein J3Q66DRAFT_366907 [Benniella sp.]